MITTVLSVKLVKYLFNNYCIYHDYNNSVIKLIEILYIYIKFILFIYKVYQIDILCYSLFLKKHLCLKYVDTN